MTWVVGILKLFGALASWLESRQLINAGKAEERVKTDEAILDKIEHADRARAEPVGVLDDDDGYRRD